MSRLPRLQSSSAPSTAYSPPMPPTVTTRNLKRKADDDNCANDDQQQPRKLAAMGTTRPIRPLRQTQVTKPPSTSSGLPKPGPSMPKPLTKPRAPSMTRPRMRGASAPPHQSTAAARARTTSRSLSRNQSSTLDADMAAEKRKLANVQANHVLISKQLRSQGANNHRRELVGYADELEQMRRKHQKEIEDLETEMVKREVETNEVNEELKTCKEDLDRERETVVSLNETITQQTMDRERLDIQIQSLNDQNASLQKQNEDLQETIEDLKSQLHTRNDVLADLHKELFESEIARRKLHNMVLELKGNIRVFCRVRPILPSDTSSSSSSSSSPEDIAAEITYPEDSKSIQLHSSTTTATGNIRHETHSFTFDRVFDTTASQYHVFEEIELLAQSCLDGHNVCIFAYGQTGSGKSYTMEGGLGEESKGMIPRAVEQVFRVKNAMKSRGWEYTVEGQFLEIYNETINDLLSSSTSAEPTKKHEIKHDLKTNTTRVTDLTIIPLTSPSQTKTLLTLANKRRSVASTLVNEHSSRSHSVFTLRISGLNVGYPEGGVKGTGEKCEGCLNLVDLAGSERLNVSFGNGNRFVGVGGGGVGRERVKETQNINRSLSALGDVIAAMGSAAAAGTTASNTNGQQQQHVPYRNSKLTYLLQNSLSGNSKTLMVLNLSPLAVHLNESLCSLRFATKVNNTQISGGGVGKKQAGRG